MFRRDLPPDSKLACLVACEFACLTLIAAAVGTGELTLLFLSSGACFAWMANRFA